MPAKIPMDVEQLRHLYFDCEMSREQVAVACGLGEKRAKAVGDRLRSAGYSLRRSCPVAKKLPMDEMVRLYQSGLNSEQVAERVGCSATNVRRKLGPLGVLRKRGASTLNRRGANSASWRGGRVSLPSGYVLVRCPGHRQAAKNGYALEHRLVASESLGVTLTPRDEVHHINGIKHDNRPENLIVVPRGDHQKLHASIHRELYRLRQEVARLSAGRSDGEHGHAWKVVG